jgi:hypothetical protein
MAWVALSLLAVCPAAGAQVVNLAPNSSFETDEVILDDPAWQMWCTWGFEGGLQSKVRIDTAQAVDGQKSLRIEPKGGTDWYFIVLDLPMPVKAGTQYTASFWAKAEKPRPLTVQMKATDNTSGTWGLTSFDLTTEWAEYHFTTAPGYREIKLEFFCAAADVPFWLDFVYFYEGEYVAGIKPSSLGSRGKAQSPSPADKATDVPLNTVLTWTPGAWANTHNVYFGTSATDVNDAQPTQPLGVLVSPGQTASTFASTLLGFDRTYYWRVDEVNQAPDTKVFKGDVWSFTTEPYSYPVRPVKATASSFQIGMGPEKTIDGSGMTGDLHGVEPSTMWMSAGVQPNWIQYEFDQVYKLHQVAVWNANQLVEAILGFGARKVTVETSLDGTVWKPVAHVPEFNRAPGLPGYAANTTFEFGGAAVKYVKLTITTSWGGLPPVGLSEVRFYTIPLAARGPTPASGATGISPSATLTWRPGREAAAHEVYLSPSQQAVIDGTASKIVTTQPSLPLAVDLGQTYYWKVVEVNQAQDPPAWPGPVWSFATMGSLVIDDFESYTDEDGSRIYQTWMDGFDNPKVNGAVVGNDPAPFAERTIVHGDKQSLPLRYHNTASVTNSETTRTFPQVQDWTKAGVTTLSLFFYGAAGNPANVPLWVKLTDQSQKSATVTFGAAGEDVAALTEPAWTEWNIPLSRFGGMNLARIQSLTIGLGPGTGAGTLFFDDIRLCPPGKTAVAVAPVLAGHWKLDNNAQDSSGNGNHATLIGGPTWVAAGRIGGALSLDGVDDYVNCGKGATLNITDTITLAAWINPTDVANGRHNIYIAKGDHSYALKHNSGNTLEFFIYDGDWFTVNSVILTADFNGAWHHVAGTYDGVQLKLYVDGVLVASRLRAGVIASTTFDVNLGRDAENTIRRYKGLIDDVRIYRGALSKAEILKLFKP